MNLAGRVVLVTGGARRVGRAIALRLARAGCCLAVHYRGSESAAEEVAATCRAAGVAAATFRADFENAAQTRELVPRVLERFGRLDVLINNASAFERMDVDAFDLGAWERTLRVNLTAPMQLVHAAREALRAAGGRVVNLTDVSTLRPWPDHLAYMAAKGALETLTRALARGLAPAVNVVGIAPGVAAWPEEYDEQTRARLLQRVPLGRAGSGADIAAVVHFVLAEGDYLTGAVIPVDGGRHVV